jgi:hypothetical protein
MTGEPYADALLTIGGAVALALAFVAVWNLFRGLI